MQIVPVLDIKNGVVVRAVGGRRADYRPLVSKLTNSTDPLEVASSLRARYHFSEIYVADLDAIEGAEPAIAIYNRLSADGFRLWVDAGVRETKNVELIADHADVVVIGSETGMGLFSREAESSEPSAIRRARLRRLRLAAKHIVFSLDLFDGQPIGNWNDLDPISIVERVAAAGISRIIVLDLARVGIGIGIGTENLLQPLIHRFADVDFFVGGGVRNADDVKRLESLSVAGVLVATALHDELI